MAMTRTPFDRRKLQRAAPPLRRVNAAEQQSPSQTNRSTVCASSTSLIFI
jgi:hypothetical protein